MTMAVTCTRVATNYPRTHTSDTIPIAAEIRPLTSMMTFPTGAPSAVMSKKTLGVAMLLRWAGFEWI